MPDNLVTTFSKQSDIHTVFFRDKIILNFDLFGEIVIRLYQAPVLVLAELLMDRRDNGHVVCVLPKSRSMPSHIAAQVMRV